MDARQTSKPQRPDPEELDHEPRDLQDEDVTVQDLQVRPPWMSGGRRTLNALAGALQPG